MSGQTRIRFGCGYQPGFFTDSSDKKISIPPHVDFMELGLPEYKRFMEKINTKGLDLSLHLSRVPMVESAEAQKIFIDYLISKIDCSHFISIGLHLSGSRYENIGRLGFTSHFTPTLQNEKQAVLFIQTFQEKSKLPIWIENANFYSSTVQEIFDSWNSIRFLCEETGSKLIVDLSHLYINAHNLDIPASIMLGAIPWKYLAEIHLSGVAQSADGTCHDSHSQPVHEEVWKLLDICFGKILSENKDIVITIEHTDSEWVHKKENYNEDFLKLFTVVQSRKNPASKNENYAFPYAVGYLKKILDRRIPKLKLACEQRNISFHALVDEWIKEVTLIGGQRIIFDEEEVPPEELKDVRIATRDFLAFAKRILKACESA